MSYRLVLELPFRVLLMHRAHFKSPMTAMHYRKRRFPTIPLDVCEQSQVDEWPGHTFVIPISRKHGGRKNGSKKRSQQVVLPQRAQEG